jgi:sec-independent protein translocase protein TatA
VDFGLPELLIILVIVVVLFGATKLPKLARSIGEAKRELAAGRGADSADGPDPRAN